MFASESASQTLKRIFRDCRWRSPFFQLDVEVVYGALPEDLVVFPLEHAAQVLEELREDHQLALVSIGNPATTTSQNEKCWYRFNNF